MRNIDEIKELIATSGLKLTPQRIAVLQALYDMKTHPTAEEIFQKAKDYIPSISLASIYNTLNSFVHCKLITTVQTDEDTVRYDVITESHHHLYCSETAKIEDFEDDELNLLLAQYFEKKKLVNFKIEQIKLQLIGKFVK